MICAVLLKGQDTLPAFSVVNKGNDRIIISWTNPYKDTIRQLSIQRSSDSVKGFKSILTLPDPTVLQNGYVDAQPSSSRIFYRLYILLDNGRYIFSLSKRPVLDTTKAAEASKNISVLPALSQPAVTAPSTQTKPAVETFTPSRYVFTDKYGNVKISLPDAAFKKYAIKFLEENGTPVFELKEIKDSILTLDKTNFVHSGWFRFELYEDGALKEKYKFFISKEF